MRAKVIAKVRETKPEQYLQVVARLMPSSHEVTVDDVRRSIRAFSDEELAALVEDLPPQLPANPNLPRTAAPKPSL